MLILILVRPKIYYHFLEDHLLRLSTTYFRDSTESRTLYGTYAFITSLEVLYHKS